MEENIKLEKGFARLEEITSELERGGLPLEKMYELYKEGMELVKKCGNVIDTVEKDILIINENGECGKL